LEVYAPAAVLISGKKIPVPPGILSRLPKRRRTMNAWTAVLALVAAAGLAAPAPDLSPDEFQKLHADLMKPEKWEGIPWKGNLLEARAQAAREKKPLFLWVMDAKPLGSV
jgi:hypothetical protein